MGIMTGNLPLVLGRLILVMLSSGHVEMWICCVILCIDVMEIFRDGMHMLCTIVDICCERMVVCRILKDSSVGILFG